MSSCWFYCPLFGSFTKALHLHVFQSLPWQDPLEDAGTPFPSFFSANCCGLTSSNKAPFLCNISLDPKICFVKSRKTAVGCLTKCKILVDFDHTKNPHFKKSYLIKPKNESSHQLEIKDVIWRAGTPAGDFCYDISAWLNSLSRYPTDLDC